MEMTTKNVFSQAVDASVRALFSTHMEDQDSELYGPSLGFSQYEPDVPAEQVSSVSGPGKGILTIEGQRYGSNTKYKGYPVTVSLDKFTSELEWTEEDIYFLKKMKSSKRATNLVSAVEGAVHALNANLNEEAAKVHYLGHGTTNLTGGDGLALYDDAHLIRAGGTQANNFGNGNTHLAFSATNLVSAVNKMNRFQNHNGRQMLPCRNLLVYGSVELLPAIDQALNSLYGPANGLLGLQQGSKEAFRRRGININSICIPDFPAAYSTYWGVIDLDRAKYRAFLAAAWMPRMNEETSFYKGTYANEASTLFGYYFNDWQWCFGSKGDDSLIS